MLSAIRARPTHDSAAEYRMYGRRLNMEHLDRAPSLLVRIVPTGAAKSPARALPSGAMSGYGFRSSEGQTHKPRLCFWARRRNCTPHPSLEQKAATVCRLDGALK